MEFDMSKITASARSKLMHSLVVPRPIALVTTHGSHGLNAAPFSFFNVFSGDPPVIALGIAPSSRSNVKLKDTATNLRENGEFVVNLVTHDLAPSMNLMATEFDEETSELSIADMETLPAARVSPPRILGSPAALESKVIEVVNLAENRYLFIAEVIYIHVEDQFVSNAQATYLDTSRMDIVAKMHGGGWYARTTDLFQLERIGLSEITSRFDSPSDMRE